MNRDAAIDAVGTGSPASSAVSVTIGSGQRIGNVDHARRSSYPDFLSHDHAIGGGHTPNTTYTTYLYTDMAISPWYIQPCPVNCIVKMDEVIFIDNCEGEIVTEYWFQYENYVEFCVYYKSEFTESYGSPFTVPWV